MEFYFDDGLHAKKYASKKLQIGSNDFLLVSTFSLIRAYEYKLEKNESAMKKVLTNLSVNEKRSELFCISYQFRANN